MSDDHSRVKLSHDDRDESCGYINANYVDVRIIIIDQKVRKVQIKVLNTDLSINYKFSLVLKLLLA